MLGGNQVISQCALAPLFIHRTHQNAKGLGTRGYLSPADLEPITLKVFLKCDKGRLGHRRSHCNPNTWAVGGAVAK